MKTATLMMKMMRWLSVLVLALVGATGSAAEYVTYLHADVQGSPLLATDEQGQVVWQEEYEPWGAREVKDAASATASRGSKVWYTGKEEEASLGMYYYGARWYSPNVGAFAATDPAVVTLNNPRSFNRYTYANNNPVRYTDPSGESPLDVAFLLYDVGHFGVALYTGVGVGAAAMDVGMSVVGVMSPIPGTGQLLKTARTAEHIAEAGRAVEHAVEGKRALEGAEQVAKACCCFVAGTPVLTEHGLQAIETLKVGDVVPSKDVASGKISLQKISKVFITEGKPLYELTLQNAQGEQEVLQVTDNHPFWVVGQGWVDSARLQQGQQVEGKQGQLTVASLKALGRSETTYNLTVDGNHNYFAGKQLALVHNCSCTLSQGQQSAIKKIENAVKDHVTDHDITGTLKDMAGTPVPKPSGGYWDHMKEMNDTLRGLRKNVKKLEGVEHPAAESARGKATEAIQKIEGAIQGFGI